MAEVVLFSIPLTELMESIRATVRAELAAQAKPAAAGDTIYLSRHEAAGKLKITLPTLSTWTKTGRIKAHRIGRRVLYKSAELDQALAPVKTASA